MLIKCFQNKHFLIVLLFVCFINNISTFPIILPSPNQIDMQNVQTQTYEGQDSNGNRIRVVQVSVGPRNLSPNKDRDTPIKTIQKMDEMVEDLINSMIISSLFGFGFPMVDVVPITNDVDNQDNQNTQGDENKQEGEINQGEENKNSDGKSEENNQKNNNNQEQVNESDNKNENTNKDINNKNKKDDNKKENENEDMDFSLDEDNTQPEPNKEKKLSKKEEKADIHENQIMTTNDNTKKKGDKIYTAKERKRQIKKERKRLWFSKVCKYIFYAIVLFTFYVILKKLLEIMDILDTDVVPANINKPENTKEEMKTIKKEGDKIN